MQNNFNLFKDPIRDLQVSLLVWNTFKSHQIDNYKINDRLLITRK